MNQFIDAILFDMGGTLRSTTRHLRTVDKDKIASMLSLLNSDVEAGKFIRLLKQRARAYRDWSLETRTELQEADLWSLWMLPDFPGKKVRDLAKQLSHLWRDANGRHTVFPETPEVILSLYRRGYRLGLVSNTTSSTEVPALLAELGIAGCFDTVLLSCVVGIRKPDPAILLMAAGKMKVSPERCAYIGDQPARDVAAARQAGFGRTVILRSGRNEHDIQQDPTLMPDHSISNLKDLLGIFPPISSGQKSLQGKDNPRYDIHLSTLWARGNFPLLEDFFLAAKRFGFSKIELNHHINSAMLDRVDLTSLAISSLHEPCPADISVGMLKTRDWMISSPDENCRQQGVASIKRSIDLARDLSIQTLVVHCGHVSLDYLQEKKLRAIYEAGLAGSLEFHEIQNQMLEFRRILIPPRLDSVKKSLLELLSYAGRFGIRLGLENRYHLYDIPNQDEMEMLLELADPIRLGIIYDVGHATVLDRLGFLPNEIWLQRFGERILGTHLHDVNGVTDHLAPGLGSVDFKQVAKYLPDNALRILEVVDANTPEQIAAGLDVLVSAGCVKLI